ncbi:SpoIID/LytB domain-containing protein [Nocardioides sp. SYSU D00038]|uniref:SpoIID/LytB domain-containing protein n=1 Tax=Nocardioides sp. SYSU D00038 TaxID=2812554 RepID=UPI0019679463|nr:SpoIID/LytB domain-containing protein [Nocardioides sp. SYSU D00038]
MTSARLLGAALTTLLLATLILGATLLPATPTTAAARAPEVYRVPASATQVEIVGRGYGHGHGMSQYGAQGAALQGRNHRQIVQFYYPGTTWGAAGGTVRVLLTADTTRDVVVTARRGLRVKSLGKQKTWQVWRSHPGARHWRIVPRAGGTTQVSYKNAARQWRVFRTFRGDAEFAAAGQPIALRLPSGKVVRYRGKLRSTRGDTVNVLPFDSYLKGVVPTEVFPSWHPQALRAQAVAARTYAARERADAPAGRHWQICDTTRCQVYGGHSAEVASTNAAVDATRGQVLLHGGRPAFTQFSASSGGWTSRGSAPYLPAQADPYDGWSGNRYHRWTRTYGVAAFEEEWPELGELQAIVLDGRDGNGEWNGRVDRVVLDGSAQDVRLSGEDFRFLLGPLPSDWFTIAKVR